MVLDVVHELTSEIRHRSEDTARDDVSLDLAKPEFDLIEPRGIGRGEMQLHTRVVAQKAPDPVGLVSGEIVQDDMHFAVCIHSVEQVLKEGDELGGRRPFR